MSIRADWQAPCTSEPAWSLGLTPLNATFLAMLQSTQCLLRIGWNDSDESLLDPQGSALVANLSCPLPGMAFPQLSKASKGGR